MWPCRHLHDDLRFLNPSSVLCLCLWGELAMGSTMALADRGILYNCNVCDLLKILKLAVLGTCPVLYSCRLFNTTLLLPCRIFHEGRTDLRMVTLAILGGRSTLYNRRCSKLLKDPWEVAEWTSWYFWSVTQHFSLLRSCSFFYPLVGKFQEFPWATDVLMSRNWLFLLKE